MSSVPEPLVWLPLSAWLDPRNWTWRVPVVVVLSWLLAGYAVGMMRLAARWPQGWRLAPRAFAWGIGAAMLALALLSPLDDLGGLFFSWHMVQHLVLLYAAPVLLQGWPYPVFLWALPACLRVRVTALLRHGALGDRLLRWATRPVVAFATGILSLWLWHYPPLYDAVLTRRWLHDLEHLTFFLGALLYWWPLIGTPPATGRFRTDGGRALYLILYGVQAGVLGALVTFWPSVLYHRYLAASGVPVERLLADQAFGGLVMWLSGPIVVTLLALATLGRASREVAESEVLTPH
jgi:putative membrane protein